MGASPELLGVALSLRAICGRQANILSTASDAERRDFINRIYELVNGDANAAIAKATGDFSVSQPQKTIAIGSSHGELIVDAEGNVIDRHLDNNDPDGGGHLASIIRFDLAEWRGYWDKLDTSDIDILDLGYWYTDTKTGRTAFAPPDAKWRSEIAEVLLERRTAAKAGAS
jgi:hypothetical protein